MGLHLMSKAEKRDHIVAPPDCTGCSLCANVCGHDAIAMVWSEEGFLIPQVDEAACVGCGLCVLKCPALQERPKVQDDLRDSVPTFGAWHRDAEVHRASSSGGVFTALASWVLAQGGCVFGVVWRDKVTAVFTKAESMEEVAMMRGSKYTTAMPLFAYREVKAELKKGRRVLFTGTPCQVHALRRYLVKDYENLLTFDIVCHGVPSHLLLEKYVREAEQEAGQTVSYVSFRGKRDSWKRFDQVCHFADGSERVCYLGEDEYMKVFLSDVVLNECCYNCRYAHFPRQGDLTLGDFWGADRLHADWPIRDGITVLLANSPKGVEAMREVSGAVETAQVPFDEVYRYQGVVFVRPHKELPQQRAEALVHLRGPQSLKAWIRRFPHMRYFGPFRVNTRSLLYRVLCVPPRLAKRLLRRLCGRGSR